MLGHFVFLRRIVADSRSTWSLDTKTRWQAILVFAFTGKVRQLLRSCVRHPRVSQTKP